MIKRLARLSLGSDIGAVLRPFAQRDPDVSHRNRLVTAYVYDLYDAISPENRLVTSGLPLENIDEPNEETDATCESAAKDV